MDSKTLTNHCFEYIREKIVTGHYLPGRKLAVVALAKEMKVGPTPVREALSRLTQTGLVEAFENQGFRVTALSEEELIDLYHTFLRIEGLAIALAMDRGGDEWTSQIIAALYQLSHMGPSLSMEEYPVWSQRNARFHAALVHGSGSPCLVQIHNQLFMQFDRYLRLALSADQKPITLNHRDHEQLAEIVLKRDKEQMYQLLEEQVKSGLDAIISTLKKMNLLT